MILFQNQIIVLSQTISCCKQNLQIYWVKFKHRAHLSSPTLNSKSLHTYQAPFSNSKLFAGLRGHVFTEYPKKKLLSFEPSLAES